MCYFVRAGTRPCANDTNPYAKVNQQQTQTETYARYAAQTHLGTKSTDLAWARCTMAGSRTHSIDPARQVQHHTEKKCNWKLSKNRYNGNVRCVQTTPTHNATSAVPDALMTESRKQYTNINARPGMWLRSRTLMAERRMQHT